MTRRKTKIKRVARQNMTQVQRMQDAISWIPKWMAENPHMHVTNIVGSYRDRYSIGPRESISGELKAAIELATGNPIEGFGIWEAEDAWTSAIIDNKTNSRTPPG